MAFRIAERRVRSLLCVALGTQTSGKQQHGGRVDRDACTLGVVLDLPLQAGWDSKVQRLAGLVSDHNQNATIINMTSPASGQVEAATKACNACGEARPLSEFYSRANRRPNRVTERTLSYRCKACDKAAAKVAQSRYTDQAERQQLPETKLCGRCRIVKPSLAFALNRSKYGGLQSTCLECFRDRKYGLRPGEYEEIRSRQSGLCAICRGPSEAGRNLSVDHCHSTGTVRGLLCQNCNAALGMMKDDPALLARAIDYLKAAIDRVI